MGGPERGWRAQSGFREEDRMAMLSVRETTNTSKHGVRETRWLSVINQVLCFQLIYSSQSLHGVPYCPNTEEGSIREVKQLVQHTGSKTCALSITRPWGTLSLRMSWERMLALEQPSSTRTHSSLLLRCSLGRCIQLRNETCFRLLLPWPAMILLLFTSCVAPPLVCRLHLVTCF